MSTSPRIKVEGSPAGDAAGGPTCTYEKGVLRIEVDSQQSDRLQRSWISLRGSCPSEGAFSYRLAEQSPDTRRLSLMIMKFKSSKDDGQRINEPAREQLKAAIWKALGELMPDCNLPDDLPKIIFHEPAGKADIKFDLAFPSHEGFQHVWHIMQIDVGGLGNNRHVFAVEAVRNSLARDVFTIDCLAFPAEEAEPVELFAALTSMTAGVGELLGIAQPTARVKGWDKDTFAASVGIIRSYIKLTRSSMAASLEELVAKIPTHLVWYGTPYELSYVGCKLHDKVVHSADFPLDAAGGTSSSTATSSPKNEAADDSSAPASKKRKMEEE